MRFKAVSSGSMLLMPRSSKIHGKYDICSRDGLKCCSDSDFHQLTKPDQETSIKVFWTAEKLLPHQQWTMLPRCLTAVVVTLATCFLLLAVFNGIDSLKSSSARVMEEELDHRLLSAMQSLSSRQFRRELSHQRLQSAASQTIRLHFPWMLTAYNNSHPNVFLHHCDTTSSAPHQVFLQSHRSSGRFIHQCLRSSLPADHAEGPAMTSDSRGAWHHSAHSFKDRIRLHSGQFTAGLCADFSPGSCQMFAIFRDPFQRAVSSYEYCKSASGDEMCRVANANDLTLREWILHQGSLLLQQLTFDPTVCNQSFTEADLRVSSHRPSLRSMTRIPLLLTPREFPCWYKHKLRLQNLSKTHQEHLQHYVLEHLDDWFSVIGLSEELHRSVQLMEHALQVPLSNCRLLKTAKIDSDLLSVNDNRSNVKQRKRDVHYDNDPEYLRYDREVELALEADVRIYEKAKEIFQFQAQRFFNVLAQSTSHS